MLRNSGVLDGDESGPPGGPPATTGAPEPEAGGPSWGSRREAFLTIFAAATLATIPAFVVTSVGILLSHRPTLLSGVVLFILSLSMWLATYLVMTWWMISAIALSVRRRLKPRR